MFEEKGVGLKGRGLELLDRDVAELDEAGGGVVFSIFPAAVVLEGERAGRGETRELRVFDHGFSVEDDGETFAAEGDFKGVPFADGFVGADFRGDAGADGGRHFGVHAVAVHFAGADGPAPDVGNARCPCWCATGGSTA